ncbi:MAG: DUF1294 domain-containing protein [Rhodobacteraceae bacterium]|nr:DUF1294 domain-containing protein [Paracoccaceae bacterium]
MDFPWLVVLLYLLAINTLTLALFALDKYRARHRRWRISEQSLLLVCLLGGTPGAYWARKRFRHKTRKQPFSSHLQMIAVLQILAGLGGLWLVLSGKDL